ncbi:MAG: hypothetical protein H5U40_18165 [Polyangiaceae bacterium]|nr:hypothetical protein [Polyangiaceae bacterium]
MPDPVAPRLSPLSPRLVEASPASAPPVEGPSFREHLASAARSLGESERGVDRALAGAARGSMRMDELVAFQAVIYRHSLTVDIASKVVEKSTSAVRQTLQSQQ